MINTLVSHNTHIASSEKAIAQLNMFACRPTIRNIRPATKWTRMQRTPRNTG